MFKDLIYIQLNTIHKTNFDKNSTVARTSGLDCTHKHWIEETFNLASINSTRQLKLEFHLNIKNI